MRTLQHTESAQFPRTVAQWDPSRPNIRGTLNVYIVLMGRGRFVEVGRKDEACDVAGLKQDVRTEKCCCNLEERRVVSKAVEGFEPLNRIVNRLKILHTRYERGVACCRLIWILAGSTLPDLSDVTAASQTDTSRKSRTVRFRPWPF